MRPKLVILYTAAGIFILFVIGSLLSFQTNNRGDKYCEQDSDCRCGWYPKEKTCAVGRKGLIIQDDQCNFFCSGFGGEVKLRCVDNECQQVFE